jgi:hypothetical protein
MSLNTNTGGAGTHRALLGGSSLVCVWWLRGCTESMLTSARLVGAIGGLRGALTAARAIGSVAPDAVKMGEMLKPQKVDGKWHKPKISARRAANLRKEAILEGSYGSYSAEEGQ